jgi:predicted AAA+ superfamily ATPase
MQLKPSNGLPKASPIFALTGPRQTGKTTLAKAELNFHMLICLLNGNIKK